MLRRFRIASQIFFIILFAVLVFGYWRMHTPGELSFLAWYMRLDPFITVITSIAARSIIPGAAIAAIIMIALTTLFGRFFCGWICPLGTCIDVVDNTIRGGKKKKPKHRPPLVLQRLKYGILAGMFLLAAAGVLFPLFMDPMLIMVRFAALIGRPELLSLVARIPGATGEIYARHPWVINGAMGGALTAALLGAFIFGASYYDRRFWCQYVCPTGAFLGLLSHFSIVKRVTSCGRDGGGCGMCTGVSCPTRALPSADYTAIVKTECIVCGVCTGDKRKCNRFTLAAPAPGAVKLPDVALRHIFGGLLGGLFLLPVLLPFTFGKIPVSLLPMRPPGAVAESQFLAKCLTCQACTNACPNNFISPAPLSKGVGAWNTPVIDPQRGYCPPGCTRCSAACPTGALVPITDSVKASTRIAVAEVDHGHCRSWTGESNCSVCARKCPYGAIEMEEHTNSDGTIGAVPVVDRSKCVGCGACEYYCPSIHEKGIKIFAIRRKECSDSHERP